MPEFNPFPTDEELWEERATDLRASIHVAMPGRIQSYDPEHQVADIVVGVKDSLIDPEGDGEYMHLTYPVIPAVPILFPRMGRWFMAMSVEPGDAVQLLFNSSAIGVWRRSTRVDNIEGLQRALQGITLVGDVARHHITHAVAVLGLETYGRALNHAPPAVQNADAAAGCMTLGHDSAEGTRVSIYRGGRVEVTHGADPVVKIEAGTPAGAPEPVALASLADGIVSSLKQHIANWVPVPNDGGASLKAHLATWNPASTAATFLKAK